MMLVELCCGSAAVSMAVINNPAPTRYMGGKGRFASAILDHLEIVPAPTRRALLVDAGPWGRLWEILPAHLAEVCAVLDELTAHPNHGDLFGELAAAPPPAEPVRWAAVFLALQTLAWRSKPVVPMADRWSTSGLDQTMAYGVPATDRFGQVRPQLPTVAAKLRRMDLSRVQGRQCDVREVDPFAAAVYIDPPYLETQGYAHDLGRADLLALVERWRSAGARVAVSEAEPLPGLRAAQIGVKGRTAGLTAAPREEWLSMTYPARQLSLGLSLPRGDVIEMPVAGEEG